MAVEATLAGVGGDADSSIHCSPAPLNCCFPSRISLVYKLITFTADTFSDPLGVPGGDDGGVATAGGGSRGGGSAMKNIFASAVASADVRSAPLVAVAEATFVAPGAVVAFAAFVMVGINRCRCRHGCPTNHGFLQGKAFDLGLRSHAHHGLFRHSLLHLMTPPHVGCHRRR